MNVNFSSVSVAATHIAKKWQHHFESDSPKSPLLRGCEKIPCQVLVSLNF
jgi:hypothetical protein